MTPVRFFALLLVALSVCVVAGAATYLAAGGTDSGPLDFAFRAAAYLLWIPLVPLVVRIARRTRSLIIHFASGLAASFATLGAHKAIFCAFMSSNYVECVCYYRLESWLARWIVVDYFVYGTIVAGTWLLDALEEMRKRDLLLSTKERELTAAELQIAHGQISPDYLTSLFDAIASRLRDDPPSAERMITKVADFLRSSVHALRSTDLTLGDDLDLLAAWADVESSRREAPVAIDVEIDARLRAAGIAAPVLQPLLARLAPDGSVLAMLSAEERGDELAVRVDVANGRTETITIPWSAA